MVCVSVKKGETGCIAVSTLKGRENEYQCRLCMALNQEDARGVRPLFPTSFVWETRG